MCCILEGEREDRFVQLAVKVSKAYGFVFVKKVPPIRNVRIGEYRTIERITWNMSQYSRELSEYYVQKLRFVSLRRLRSWRECTYCETCPG